MTTDLHVAVECGFVRDEGDGSPANWRWRAEVDVDQDYSLFGRLVAGVRGDAFSEPLDDPRGLPSDVDLRTRQHFDWWGGHDPSWFYLSELLEHDWSGYTPIWSSFLRWVETWEGCDAVRLVLWFDS